MRGHPALAGEGLAACQEDRQIDGETYLAHLQEQAGPIDAIEYAWSEVNPAIPFPRELALPAPEFKFRMARSKSGPRSSPTKWTCEMDAVLDARYPKARAEGALPQLAAELGVTRAVMQHRAKARNLTLTRDQTRAGSKRSQILARLGNGIVAYGVLRALAREFDVPEKRVRNYASQLRSDLKRATVPAHSRPARTGRC